jgi:hypothetical protein
MKKLFAVAIVVLFAMIVLNLTTVDLGDAHVMWDGDEVGGPLAALVGLVAGGAGLLLAGVVLLIVGVVLAVVFAGLGVLAVVGIAAGAVVLAALMSPLLLPLLVPLAFIWFFTRRSRRAARIAKEQTEYKEQAV